MIDHDVVVIGAGFAGLTAARELSRHHRVLVLEARDRIGGRTWTDHRLGRDLDMGGTWVHWVQPHTWAELTRYGIGIEPSPAAQRVYWRAGGGVHDVSPEEFAAFITPGQEAMLADAPRLFPRPHDPLRCAEVAAIDGLSVAERLAQLGLAGEELNLHAGIWAEHFNAPAEVCGYAAALRWSAQAGGRHHADEAASRYRVVGGTRALADAIRADVDAPVHLGTPVDRVETAPDGVVVHTPDGPIRARRVVVTAGLNALRTMAFEPGLPPRLQRIADQGSASRGIKTWIQVRGTVAPFSLYGGRDEDLTFARTEFFDAASTTLVAFGPRRQRLDPDDTDAVARALARFRPDLEVLAATGHDWVGDPWAGQTWPVLQPGQLTGGLLELAGPFGPVHFAGSDIAAGWSGFIDGAIESGLSAARSVHRALADA